MTDGSKPDVREVRPILAALANFLGFGLGYVYLGRIAFAGIFILVVIGYLALAGWSGLLFDPVAFVVVATILVVIALTPVVHCFILAKRNRSVAYKRYNRPWVYVVWFLGSLMLQESLIALRAPAFGYETFRIPSASMAPTIESGDFVMANTRAYRHADPAFGDVVVFSTPDREGVKYAKRIVGLPGDKIEIVDGTLVRNGTSVPEPYVASPVRDSGQGHDFALVMVSPGAYFLLGDNRQMSHDSRHFGAIDKAFLHGRIEHIWFSYDGGVNWERFPQTIEAAHETGQNSEQ